MRSAPFTPVTHIFVDGMGACGVLGPHEWTLSPAATTCPACRFVLHQLGAPARTLLQDEGRGGATPRGGDAG